MWWSGVFAVLALAGVAMAVKHTRESGWRHGRHWVHLIVGSAGMVIMTLAMTSTPSGPVLALGHSSMAHMPGMEGTASTAHGHGTASAEGMESMEGMKSMEGMGSAHGTDMPGMTQAAADTGASSGWRLLIVALAVYFALSIGASVWARARRPRKSGRGAGARFSWSRWLLAMPDTVFVFLASLTTSVWDRTHTAQRSGHGRRRRLGPAPEAALAAHIGMGGTMSAMLLMMAV
jgi:hypothetical protein